VLLRIGSGGDPCAVPEHVWLPLISRVAAHTGYTHQWRNPVAAWARGVLQASCDGFADYLDATAHGWSTFLVTPADAPAPAGTVCRARPQNHLCRLHPLRRRHRQRRDPRPRLPRFPRGFA
jgi:hypothetical protein